MKRREESSRFNRVACFIAFSLACLAGQVTKEASGSFTDVAVTVGMVDALSGHGAAWGDYDGDSDLDVFVAIEGGQDRLYRNNGNGESNDHCQRSAGIGAATAHNTRRPGTADDVAAGVWRDSDDTARAGSELCSAGAYEYEQEVGAGAAFVIRGIL